MSRLIRANFARLLKSRSFMIIMAYTLFDAVWTVADRYLDIKKYPEDAAYISENLPFGQTVDICLLMAVFIGFFIGTEYSDGTIRNKLTVGHSRTAVYLSNLAVCTAVSVMIELLYAFVITVPGIPLLGNFIKDGGKFLRLGVCGVTVAAAFAAVLLPLGMLIHSKAAGAVTAILLSLGMIFAAMIITFGLQEPMLFEEQLTVDPSGQVVTHEAMENPFYVSGAKRRVYEALYDILPSCQAARVQMDDLPESPVRLPAISLGLSGVLTVFGIAVFKRKDLK